jgi:RNA polymerase sigma-70 factor (ECF subfamily)
MSAEQPFSALIQRLRAGDPQAAAELIQLYEPEVRRFIRVYLTDPQLRRVYDSADIFQSVFANFYVRLIGGQYDIAQPGQLIRLLATMAHNKVVDHARRQAIRPTVPGGSALRDDMPGSEKTPSDIVAEQELLRAVHGLLSDEERFLVEQRADGRSWAEIAAACGDSADAVRKRLTRALDRVCEHLGVGVRDDA